VIRLHRCSSGHPASRHGGVLQTTIRGRPIQSEPHSPVRWPASFAASRLNFNAFG
jgi:hypothetical protein